ncbi:MULTISPECIES: ectoine/hydroxyectoine ABC transporter permease subunit EhuC [unclassified Brevibacterium]|jgi:polar amino acid transport system permease protein|uniref:ectoine/hydroxyectoine ABC transporter permease subunit EhuC n=1 Tax=unclassified Brevibacterium TaxID=2614124 RepID=UPI001BAD907B|nr:MULTISPECIES: ectoine/hydroxyectoine ABC transporter permease subunit EhuC [unclassified Brevibacterium]QUL80018.1 ectoine/hydroxyectoine ABC transporter permease subunit EhuC [Brevibacterium sp. SMBL_HHYL_HB1]HJA60497.1 ectoine/hydroxyectoine ABC transporter permease subunit EhuC [Candidatus Brevibacterium intestinavium]
MTDNIQTLLNFLPQLWEGVQTTIILTVLGSIGAIVIALVLGLTMTSSHAWLRVPARIIVEFFRGTSLLVQLFWLFYVFPLLGVDLDPMVCGIGALALNYGAYSAEVVRSSIITVDKGQWEGAIALSLSPTRRMVRVIFPQAWALMIPSLATLLIQLLKGSAVVSFITLQDLTEKIDQLRQSTNDTYFSFTIGLIIYFVIAWLLQEFMNFLERRATARLGRRRPNSRTDRRQARRAAREDALRKDRLASHSAAGEGADRARNPFPGQGGGL